MAHCNTLFHTMLNFIPRHQFTALEKRHSTGRRSRSFSRWSQFVHLMFMQLTGRSRLRDGIQSMNSRADNPYHLGAKPVSRSTFADANNGRPALFYDALFSKKYISVAGSFLRSTSSNSKTSCSVWTPRLSIYP